MKAAGGANKWLAGRPTAWPPLKAAQSKRVWPLNYKWRGRRVTIGVTRAPASTTTTKRLAAAQFSWLLQAANTSRARQVRAARIKHANTKRTIYTCKSSSARPSLLKANNAQKPPQRAAVCRLLAARLRRKRLFRPPRLALSPGARSLLYDSIARNGCIMHTLLAQCLLKLISLPANNNYHHYNNRQS